MSEAATLIGVTEPLIFTADNGGTTTRGARGAGVIDIGKIVTYDTPREYDQAIDRLAATANHVLDGKQPDAVGVSIAAAMQNGRIASAGELEARGWRDKPIVEDIAAALGTAVERVTVLNDCKAGANAERVARHPRPGVIGSFNTLGTGLGGALYTGDAGNELIADEPGHHHLKPGAVCGCGAEGHIEAHIGGSGIARKYGVRGEHIPHNDQRWKEIKDDFHSGMALTLDRYKEELGLSLNVIGFTGSVALRGPNMLGDLQRHLYDRYGNHAPRVEKAIFLDESGLYGAAFAADALLKTM